MNTAVTVKHLRIMLDAAYIELEKRREAKARSEGVAYVPSEKPINICSIDDALEWLDKLNDERTRVEWWFRASENRVEYFHFEKLLGGLKKFGVTFHIVKDSSGGDDIVNIQSGIQETHSG